MTGGRQLGFIRGTEVLQTVRASAVMFQRIKLDSICASERGPCSRCVWRSVRLTGSCIAVIGCRMEGEQRSCSLFDMWSHRMSSFNDVYNTLLWSDVAASVAPSAPAAVRPLSFNHVLQTSKAPAWMTPAVLFTPMLKGLLYSGCNKAPGV